MKTEEIVKQIEGIGIKTIIGVPDSTLKELCYYLDAGMHNLAHYVTANEGASVGLAAGIYLGTGKPACVYMQNSGIGNAVNPIASLLHKEVYDIPALFIVGWRGEPGIHDEPQHKFQGKITREMFDLLGIENAVIDSGTTSEQLKEIFRCAQNELDNNKQFAIIVKNGTFDKYVSKKPTNKHKISREDAIKVILKQIEPTDIIVSTTGKISRELYEESDIILKSHEQSFFVVGSMGHASMIAFGLAKEKCGCTVYCIDGDGAVLMHMGALAFIAKQCPRNMIHIVLNNEAHESVGGMPTCAVGASIAEIAKACGYPYTYSTDNLSELKSILECVKKAKELCLIEIKVCMESRPDLGRPKEAACENKEKFMKYHGII